MLWGDVGWVKQTDRQTAEKNLDWAVIQKVFDSGMPHNASLILSGGEPTMHPDFGRLLLLLKERRKFAIICTNGLWLDRFVEELDGNPYPTLLVSLDGDRELNEKLRGPRVYERVIANLERLQALRRPPFIGIQFTVMPENVSDMERFCEEMVARGVDWILLNPGWFLSPQQAREHEAAMQRLFGVTPTTHLGYVREYDYDKDAFQAALERIWNRAWPIQIASHLKEPEWVQDFIEFPDKLLGNRLCYKQWLRLDVLPDGRVPPCVQFPDLTVGDLTTQSVAEVWHGAQNRRFQKVIHREPLPICAKCDNIYLYNGTGKGDPAFRARGP
jgi:radical SAM protein with 4Fe4S-binding SPASM domain